MVKIGAIVQALNHEKELAETNYAHTVYTGHLGFKECSDSSVIRVLAS